MLWFVCLAAQSALSVFTNDRLQLAPQSWKSLISTSCVWCCWLHYFKILGFTFWYVVLWSTSLLRVFFSLYSLDWVAEYVCIFLFKKKWWLILISITAIWIGLFCHDIFNTDQLHFLLPKKKKKKKWFHKIEENKRVLSLKARWADLSFLQRTVINTFVTPRLELFIGFKCKLLNKGTMESL